MAELHNSGTTSVDVRNWYFSNKACKTLTLDSNSIVGYDAANASTYTLAPGDYMIVARNGASNFYVANSNDFMTLYDSSSGWIDEATWNSSSSGVSLEETCKRLQRLDSNFKPNTWFIEFGGGTGGQPMFKAMSSSMRSWPTLGQVTITPLGPAANGLKSTTTALRPLTSLVIGCRTLQEHDSTG